MRLGAVVGRFQTHKLHDGYFFFFKEILKKCDKILIVLGTSPLPASRHNPFSYQEREAVIRREFAEHGMSEYLFNITKVRDMHDDAKWSKQLDEEIERQILLTPNPIKVRVKLFGSRDCFISYYTGDFPTVIIKEEDGRLSSTRTREALLADVIHDISMGLVSNDFLAGKLKAVYEQFPKTFPTVDVAILDEHQNILLGRKPNEDKFRFPGGFVDATDLSYEAAAKREAIEECGHIELADFRYVASMRVNDWRYMAEVDKIMTTLFRCKYIFGAPKGSDDLAEVKWVPLSDVNETNMVSEHLTLFGELMMYEYRDDKGYS